MTTFLSSLSNILLFIGCFCNIVASIGLFRFPDFYSRVHAAGVIDTLGTGLILSGLILQSGWDTSLSKLILILLFILLTSPTVSFILANTATRNNLKAKIGMINAPDKGKGESSSNP